MVVFKYNEPGKYVTKSYFGMPDDCDGDDWCSCGGARQITKQVWVKNPDYVKPDEYVLNTDTSDKAVYTKSGRMSKPPERMGMGKWVVVKR